MSGKIVFIAGVLGIGGYVGHTMRSYDPAVFDMSREQVEAALVDAETSLPRKDGDGRIRIWAAGASTKGVSLRMRYAEADWAPLITCEAVITPVAEGRSRVVPDCGGGGSGSAIADTTDALRAPMFDEFIQSTLRKRAFNRDMVDRKEAGVVMRNLGGMQREALKRSDEMQRMQAEADGE